MKRLTHPGNRGQNLAEFAIALPILIVLILVIVDLGRITYAYSTLYNAVREGARYGAIHYDDLPAVENFAESYAIGLDRDPAVLNIGASYLNETITVVGTYDFSTASPILRLIINEDSYELRSEVSMRTEE